MISPSDDSLEGLIGDLLTVLGDQDRHCVAGSLQLAQEALAHRAMAVAQEEDLARWDGDAGEVHGRCSSSSTGDTGDGAVESRRG